MSIQMAPGQKERIAKRNKDLQNKIQGVNKIGVAPSVQVVGATKHKRQRKYGPSKDEANRYKQNQAAANHGQEIANKVKIHNKTLTQLGRDYGISGRAMGAIAKDYGVTKRKPTPRK